MLGGGGGGDETAWVGWKDRLLWNESQTASHIGGTVFEGMLVALGLRDHRNNSKRASSQKVPKTQNNAPINRSFW